MPKRGAGKTSGRSPRARRPRSTSARSSSSKGIKRSVRLKPAAADDRALRALLARALAWHDAHADLYRAAADLPAEIRGQRPAGMPHSPWEILEHLRISQHDILDFCRNPQYVEMKWPDDYWPPSPAPPDARAWDSSVTAFHRDLSAVQDLAADPRIDLAARIPHGSGQTYLREILLVIDHNAYHVGELVAIRRMLGAWT